VMALIAEIRPLRCHASWMGVLPRGASVRRTSGARGKPGSSRKTW
jgi:hypothetical protein